MDTRTLITGASSGIGLEFAQIFAREKHDLVLVAIEDDLLKEAEKEIKAEYGVKVLSIVKDLTEDGAVKDVYDEVVSNGIEIDILVNNAGFGDYCFFSECNWEKQEKMIKLNVIALTHLTRLFLPAMVSRKQGNILNLASNSAFQPGPGMSIYFASKAFVLSFSEAIANELEGTGVKVTALCPGSTKTRFNSIAAGNNDKQYGKSNRPGPKEVAEFGYKQMLKGKTIALHGLKNALIIFAIRFLPRSFVTNQARKIQAAKFCK